MAEYDDIDAPADPPGEGADPFDASLDAEDEITADDVAPAVTPDPEPVDSVGEAVESVDEGDDPNAPPPPVTPSSSASQAQDRIWYENQVNADAEAFAARAKASYIEAAISGQPITITITTPDE